VVAHRVRLSLVGIRFAGCIGYTQMLEYPLWYAYFLGVAGYFGHAGYNILSLEITLFGASVAGSHKLLLGGVVFGAMLRITVIWKGIMGLRHAVSRDGYSSA